MNRSPQDASDPSPLIEPLDASHERSTFRCGVEQLDRYLIAQAGQDARRFVAAPYVLTFPPDKTIAGYYTLSSASIVADALPASTTRRLPRYPVIPATLLGRLAVDGEHRGRRLGELLLLNALRRSARSEIATFAVIVDASDDTAAAFYRRYGFLSFPDRPARLFLPMAEIVRLLG